MRKYTVFVASPSDVQKERKSLQKVIDEINLTHGQPFGYQLNLWNYEKNAYPSANEPQEHINEIAAPYQIFIGIMWNRFGTPTSNAGSGTEEEYNIAYQAWQKKEVVDILFYFCNKPFRFEKEVDVDQFKKVLQFKKKLNGKSFIWEYANPRSFKDQIRKHLCHLMNNEMKRAKNPGRSLAKPNQESIKIFRSNWARMSPELQNHFSIPYNENRMGGDGGIQTRDFFASIVTNPDKELQTIMKHIPKDALPEPIEGKVIENKYIEQENPWLSHCITSSVQRLGKAIPPDRQITPMDIFIDIAKNGTGESVRLLREHNITSEKIDEILKKENLIPLQAE